jgi:ubiquinone/menaquinone biosynthesis C-methylase UbiE
MLFKHVASKICCAAGQIFENPEAFLTMLGVKETDRILQIGCSSGYYTRALARIAQDGTVYVIDPCSKALARVTAESDNGHNIVTICCSPDALLLPRLTFDKVFCLNGLPPLSNPERAVNLWCELLKSRGKFFLRANSHLKPRAVQAFSKDSLYHVGTMKGVDVFVKDWEQPPDETDQPAEVYSCFLLPDALFEPAR